MNKQTGWKAGLLALSALALTIAPTAAAQEKGARTSAGLAAALERQTRRWADARVPRSRGEGLDREAIEELLSPGPLLVPRRATFADVAGTGMPVFRLNKRGEARVVGDGSEWAPRGALGLDPLLDHAARQVDIRGHARNLVKQRIVKEILSRTAFGRGLGLLIDTGAPPVVDADGLERAARSKLLPYVSPKVDASEGKVELRLTWKF